MAALDSSDTPPIARAREKLPVCVLAMPKNQGPTVPPRLPTPLIRPIPTPATLAGSTSPGRVQNGPKRPRNAPMPIDRQITVAQVPPPRSEEHTSELQSHVNLVCRLLL